MAKNSKRSDSLLPTSRSALRSIYSESRRRFFQNAGPQSTRQHGGITGTLKTPEHGVTADVTSQTDMTQSVPLNRTPKKKKFQGLNANTQDKAVKTIACL